MNIYVLMVHNMSESFGCDGGDVIKAFYNKGEGETVLGELGRRESSDNENFESLKNKIFNIQDHNERLNFIKSLSSNDSELFSKECQT